MEVADSILRAEQLLEGSELSWKSNGALKSSIDYLLTFNKYISVEDKSKAYLALKLASLSISYFLTERKKGNVIECEVDVKAVDGSVVRRGKNLLQLWIEHSTLILVIHRIFDDSAEDNPELKKLALDLGYVILNEVLDFSDDSFGFKAPLRSVDVQLISLTTKYLESFMVTFPTHYPFMPAKHFAAIRWPIVVSESCSGKVHSIFQFLSSGPSTGIPEEIESSDDGVEKSETASSEQKSALDNQSAIKYCNYENGNRRQPWGGKFSTLQLLHLVHEILESKEMSCGTSCFENEVDGKKGSGLILLEPTYATEIECNSLISMLTNVFDRVKRVDSGLLYRDKQKTLTFHESGACFLCNQQVGSFIERINPFASIFRKSSTKPQSSAPSVASTDTWITVPSVTSTASTTSPTGVNTVTNTVNIFPNSGSKPTSMQQGTQQRHHCRLCLKTICTTCCAEDMYVGDRICRQCDQATKVVGLYGLEEKKPKTRSLLAAFCSSAPTSTEDAVTTAQVDQLAELVQREISTEFVDDERSICCSMLLTDSLRSWRDLQNDD